MNAQRSKAAPHGAYRCRGDDRVSPSPPADVRSGVAPPNAVADTLAPALRNVGMVTSALWTDVDDDGWSDLVLTLDWGKNL